MTTPSAPPATRVALLGLGRMGHAMAGRILAAGYPLAVWNRTAERGRDVADRGARLAASPADAARDADVVITILADPPAVRAVLLGDAGVLATARKGAVLVDASTVGPADSREFAAACAARGVRFVDAPVLGSSPVAEQGKLTTLAGGEAAVVAEVEPVLRTFSATVVRAGATGQGSTVKLCMNMLVAGLTEVLAESIVLADRAGLAPSVLRETLAASVLSSPFLGYKAPQLFERRFAPLFTTRLLLKDLDLALTLARETGIVLPGTSAVRGMYARAAEAGHGDDDFAAVIDAVAND
jgi:3-hydroxyisobutyrate dehydrogenase-like beta-hydroxyacid dehydrogenase